jgi:hypothetical protein
MPLTDNEKTSSEGSKLLISYLRTFLRFAGWKVWISIALMVLLGFTQGIGLLMLIPLLRIIGIGDPGGSGGQVFTFIKDLFHGTGIPLTVE